MSLGAYYEAAACQYLVRRGLALVARNFRGPRGEIDLIMRDGGTLVFVEVKFRSSTRYGSPLEAVSPMKQRRIKNTALFYLSQTKCCYSVVRFDVLGITKTGQTLKYLWVKGAFE